MRFVGQWFDVDAQLVYNHHRWYDARVGRYLRPDPLFEQGQWQDPYMYVQGNPYTFSDPLGLWSVDQYWGPDYVWDDVRNAVRGAHNAVRDAHYARNNFNDIPNYSPMEGTYESLLKSEGFNKAPSAANAYHRNSSPYNKKYLGPYGHREAIVDEFGNLVTDPRDVGTFNLFGSNHWYNFPYHFFWDMLPYYLWGNSCDDTTSLSDRLFGH